MVENNLNGRALVKNWTAITKNHLTLTNDHNDHLTSEVTRGVSQNLCTLICFFETERAI